MSLLSDLRKKRDDKSTELKAVLDSAKNPENPDEPISFHRVDDDLLPTELKGKEGVDKTEVVAAWWMEQNEELNGEEGLGARVDKLDAAQKAAEAFEKREKSVKRPVLPGKEEPARKSIGQLVTEHPAYQRAAGEKGEGGKAQFEIPGRSFLTERKTLFETTAGWAPESTRTGMVTPDVTRPIQLIDIVPSVPTGQAAVVYMEETTRTHGATEIAENSAYPESAFALTERTSNVRKIGTSIPVTDEQLADVPFASAYLDERLPFGVEQRLDSQLISGDGIAPNLEGLVNVTGIQTRDASASTSNLDAMYEAQDDVRVTGRAIPTHNVMHSTDWQAIRLAQTGDGVYLYGSPSEAAPERLWGLPLVRNEALTASNAFVGSFQMSWIFLAERSGIIVEVGYVNDDFLDGRRTIRAGGRWAFVVPRPAAFNYVSNL